MYLPPSWMADTECDGWSCGSRVDVYWPWTTHSPGRIKLKFKPLHFVLLCCNHLTFTLIQIRDNCLKERKLWHNKCYQLKQDVKRTCYQWGYACCCPLNYSHHIQPKLIQQIMCLRPYCICTEIAAALFFNVTLRGVIKKPQAGGQETWV